MANVIRIVGVLFVLGICGYALFNLYGVLYRPYHHYTPIDNTPVAKQVEALSYPPNYKVVKSQNPALYDVTPTIIATPKVTPNATPSPIVKPTVAPSPVSIPTEKHTDIKANDIQKLHHCDMGIETNTLTLLADSTFGYDYYYNGDIAVFKLDFENIGNNPIINPTLNIWVNGIKFRSEKLNLELLALYSKQVNYYSIPISGIPSGFYKIEFDVIDDNGANLMSFYKDVDIL